MQSPFPGMDPYIEAAGVWEDFHTKLIGDTERYVSSVLPERYVVRAGERSYIDSVKPFAEEERAFSFQPDVGIRSSTDASQSASESAAVAMENPDGIVMHAVMETEYRELFLEIREMDPQERLVTCIEILSPSNKKFASVGWELYSRKRQLFVEGRANLVEIDLLRRGRRHAMEEPWPDSPYYLGIFRKETAPACRVLPAYFDRPLPKIPIPLLPPDPDVVLDIQALVEAVYLRSRYARKINYNESLKPSLTPTQLAWLEQRLRDLQPHP